LSPALLTPSSPGHDGTYAIKANGYGVGLAEDPIAAKVKPEYPNPDPIEPPLVDIGAYEDDSDEEENPFHLYAMTQVVVESDLKPDINPNLIARQNGCGEGDFDIGDAEEAEYEAQERRHAEDARMRAEAGVRARASQLPRSETGDDGFDDEFDDDELDELFRRTVMPGALSAQTTPRKNRQNGGGPGSGTGTFTPTTRSGGSRTSVDTPSTGGRSGYGAVEMQERRATREMRMRNEAGWGDLSTILDQSSLNGSSPHGSNPYHGGGTRTPPSVPGGPDRKASPAPFSGGLPSAHGEKTPTHRNPFAKPRTPSPLVTPTKRGVWPPNNTVILPPSRRSAARFSPDRDETTPTNAKKPGPGIKAELKPSLEPHSTGTADVKPDVEDLKEIAAELPDADVSVLFAPGQQKKGGSASEKTDSGKMASNEQEPIAAGVPPTGAPDIIVSSQFSPTQVVPELPSAEHGTDGDPTGSQDVNGASSQTLHPSNSRDINISRPRKRVRMAGPIDEPDNPFSQPVVSHASQASQRSERSQLSVASSQSNRLSVHTDASSVPSAPTVTSDGKPTGTSKTAWTFVRPPPLARNLQEYLDTEGIATVEYQSPYYSNPVDVPPRAKMFAGRMFSLKGSAVKDLHEFEHAIQLDSEAQSRRAAWLHNVNAHPPVVRAKYGWEFVRPLTRVTEVVRWCDEEDAKAMAEGMYLARFMTQEHYS
jgi:DNA polymerase zeta